MERGQGLSRFLEWWEAAREGVVAWWMMVWPEEWLSQMEEPAKDLVVAFLTVPHHFRTTEELGRRLQAWIALKAAGHRWLQPSRAHH